MANVDQQTRRRRGRVPAMLRHCAAPIAALAIGLASPTAQAQGRPVFPPTRDVAVTYRVEHEGQVTSLRLAWSAGLRALRGDTLAGTPATIAGMPLPPGAWVVVDLNANRAFAAEDRSGLTLDLPQLASQAQSADSRLASTPARRLGSDRVANLPCIIWRIEPQAGMRSRRPLQVCLTADGVPLRAEEEGRRGRAEATAVQYRQQDAARFRPPQGGMAGGGLGGLLGDLLRGGGLSAPQP